MDHNPWPDFHKYRWFNRESHRSMHRHHRIHRREHHLTPHFLGKGCFEVSIGEDIDCDYLFLDHGGFVYDKMVGGEGESEERCEEGRTGGYVCGGEES